MGSSCLSVRCPHVHSFQLQDPSELNLDGEALGRGYPAELNLLQNTIDCINPILISSVPAFANFFCVSCPTFLWFVRKNA